MLHSKRGLTAVRCVFSNMLLEPELIDDNVSDSRPLKRCGQSQVGQASQRLPAVTWFTVRQVQGRPIEVDASESLLPAATACNWMADGGRPKRDPRPLDHSAHTAFAASQFPGDRRGRPISRHLDLRVEGSGL